MARWACVAVWMLLCVHVCTAVDRSPVAVILEPRNSPKLPRVVNTYRELLPPEWTINVFHGVENEGLLLDDVGIAQHIQEGGVVLRPLPDGFDLDMYNHLLANHSFWRMFTADYMLLFEMDSILCSNPTKGLDAFVEEGWDFVGSPWDRGDCGQPGRWMPKCVGNSGLSLWRRRKMVWLTSKPIRDRWDGKPHSRNIDMFISHQLQAVAPIANLPDRAHAKYFAAETVFTGGYTPFGVHKPWPYFRGEDRQGLLRELYERCPELAIIGPPAPE